MPKMKFILKLLPSKTLDSLYHLAARELKERQVIKTWLTQYNPNNPEVQTILKAKNDGEKPSDD